MSATRRPLRAAALAAAILWAAPLSAAAEPQPPVAQVSGQALELARLMAPRDLMVQAELDQFDKHFRESLLEDEDSKALESDYPGIIDAMAKAARPLVAEETAASIDKLHPAIASLLQGSLSEAEVSELGDFYSSPAGRHLIEHMILSVDASDKYRDAVDGNVEVSEDDVTAATWIAGMKAVGSLSKEDYAALKAFGDKPAFARLKTITPEIHKTTLGIMGASSPEFDKRMETALRAAMRKFIPDLPDE